MTDTPPQNPEPVPPEASFEPITVPDAVSAAEEEARLQRLRDLGLLDDEEDGETPAEVRAERDSLRTKVSEMTDRLTRVQREVAEFTQEFTSQKRAAEEAIAATLGQLKAEKEAALESFVKDVTPVVSNLEGSFAAICKTERASDPKFDKTVQGMERIVAQLSSVFNNCVVKKDKSTKPAADAVTPDSTAAPETQTPATPETPAADAPKETDADVLAERDSLRKKVIEITQTLSGCQQQKLKLINQISEQKRDTEQAVARTQRQVDEQKGFVLEKFLQKEVLPVVDNLERGLSAIPAAQRAADARFDSLAKGVETALGELTVVFNKIGLTAINPKGQDFDSAKHEALTVTEEGDQEVDTVVSVVQKGYELKGRVIRHAKVIVKA